MDDKLSPENQINPPTEQSQKCFNPWLFFGFLFAPTILATITLTTGNSSDYGMTAMAVVLIGSIITGPVCATHLIKKKQSLSTPAAVGLWILTAIACALGAVGLAFGGCLLLISNL